MAWKLNEQKCATFNRLNKDGTVCNACIKVCPWTRPVKWHHNLVRLSVIKFRAARIFAIMADNILGRGKLHKESRNEKWWFDLEEVNGRLRIPNDASN
jgi:hypothetical protein